MKKTYILRDGKNAARIVQDLLWPLVRDWFAEGGAALMVKVSLLTRSASQNARLHALLTDFAKSDVQWAGKRRSLEEWKVILVSGHAVATKHEAEVVEGLEHELVALRESTASMGVRRASSLIDYVQAHAAMLGVPIVHIDKE